MAPSPCMLAFLLILTLSASALEDPTRPKTVLPVSDKAAMHIASLPPAEEALPWTLQYILNAPHRHLASINHQLVSEGEAIAGWTLQTVNANSVVLSRAGKQQRLLLFKPSGPLPPATAPAPSIDLLKE